MAIRAHDALDWSPFVNDGIFELTDMISQDVPRVLIECGLFIDDQNIVRGWGVFY